MSEFKETPSIKAVLIAARKLIEKKENWCKRGFAKTKAGRQVDAYSSEAYAFCTIGAIKHVVGDNGDEQRRDAAKLLHEVRFSHIPFVGEYYIYTFNDGYYTTHQDVLNLFDRAIEKAPQS